MLLGALSPTSLEGNPMTLALQALGRNETLDLGGLGVVRLALAGDGTTDDELADVVFLVEREELADVVGTLGPETLGLDGVGQAGKLTLALLDDADGHDGKVGTGDGYMLISTKSRHADRVRLKGVPPRTLLRRRSPVFRGR